MSAPTVIDHLATLRCPVRGCKVRRREYQFCCSRCWRALTPELRDKFNAELSNARKAGTRHTQELLSIRDECIRLLNALNDERRARAAERFNHERS
jgi:hypothetical protein